MADGCFVPWQPKQSIRLYQDPPVHVQISVAIVTLCDNDGVDKQSNWHGEQLRIMM